MPKAATDKVQIVEIPEAAIIDIDINPLQLKQTLLDIVDILRAGVATEDVLNVLKTEVELSFSQVVRRI